MIEAGGPIPPQDSGHSEMEELLMAAGRYVQPSEDLRPRTIELARDRQSVVNSRRRLGWSALAATLLVSFSIQWVRQAGSDGGRFDSRTSQELHQSALQRSAETGVSLDWALSQAYDDLRRSQAKTIGAAFK